MCSLSEQGGQKIKLTVVLSANKARIKKLLPCSVSEQDNMVTLFCQRTAKKTDVYITVCLENPHNINSS